MKRSSESFGPKRGKHKKLAREELAIARMSGKERRGERLLKSRFRANSPQSKGNVAPAFLRKEGRKKGEQVDGKRKKREGKRKVPSRYHKRKKGGRSN